MGVRSMSAPVVDLSWPSSTDTHVQDGAMISIEARDFGRGSDALEAVVVIGISVALSWLHLVHRREDCPA